jgi:hypothetical protein
MCSHFQPCMVYIYHLLIYLCKRDSTSNTKAKSFRNQLGEQFWHHLWTECPHQPFQSIPQSSIIQYIYPWLRLSPVIVGK